MEQNTNLKISHAKNINKFNFNTIISAMVDNNANVKNVLSIDTYLYDLKVESGNGKAFLNGKIGAKIIYIDLDNMINTITQSQSFSETYVDALITNETYLNVCSSSISNNILSADNVIKISCDIHLYFVAYLNLSLSSGIEKTEDLITKNLELKTHTISNQISSQFEHSTMFEIKDSISKIIYNSTHFTADKIVAYDNYLVVEGKVCSQMLYETSVGDEMNLKEVKNVENVKYDIEFSNLTKEEILDLTITLDKSNETVNVEIEDGQSIVSVKNIFKVCGVSLKPISIDLVDDLYSVKNQIETTITKREFSKTTEQFNFSEVFSNEISLSNDESAIDEIVSNLNVLPEITNTYVKDGNLYVEGLVVSTLIFVDENKEIKNKQIETPFIINSKFNLEKLDCFHHTATIIDSRVKVKRGTILEFEYTIVVNICIHETDTIEIVDSVKVGKPISCNYDFQIFVAKPNETLWELCKRTNATLEDLSKQNKDLPLTFVGGERVVVRR